MRKCSTVQKDLALRILAEQEAGRLKHDLHAEIVLCGRIFDVFRREERSTNLVFAQYAAKSDLCQRMGKRGLPCSGKAGHENDHMRMIGETGIAARWLVRTSDRDFVGLRRHSWENGLTLAPVCVPIGDHHVKAPM